MLVIFIGAAAGILLVLLIAFTLVLTKRGESGINSTGQSMVNTTITTATTTTTSLNGAAEEVAEKKIEMEGGQIVNLRDGEKYGSSGLLSLDKMEIGSYHSQGEGRSILGRNVKTWNIELA